MSSRTGTNFLHPKRRTKTKHKMQDRPPETASRLSILKEFSTAAHHHHHHHQHQHQHQHCSSKCEMKMILIIFCCFIISTNNGVTSATSLTASNTKPSEILLTKLEEKDAPPFNGASTTTRGRRQASSEQPAQLQPQFEVAEGFTMEPAGASGGSNGFDNNNNNNNNQQIDAMNNQNNKHQWPLKQLDRIKSESKVSALVGQNAILNCAVQFKDGIEKPFVVNWFKYPNKLPIYIWYAGYPPHIAQDYENRAFRLGQASLNLTKVRQTDQGLYECKIYYLDRRPEDKGNGTWIYLDVQAPPHFSQTPAPVSYVQAGDSLHLTCRAESTPSPILRWYKNKIPIDSDTGSFRLVQSINGQQVISSGTSDITRQRSLEAAASSNFNSNDAFPATNNNANQLDLFIDNIQAGHTTGEYVCLASNSEGSIEARSQVLLAVPAVITTMPRNQTRLEGEKAELLCQAKGLPSNITYKWFFNDKPLDQLKWFESRFAIRHDGTLVIHSIHRNDQGDYKCQATNGLLLRKPTTSVPYSPRKSQLNTKAFGAKKSHDDDDDINSPIFAEASAHLNVEFPARISYSPPVQYLPLGLSGIIRCFYQASPSVEFFTWTLNNQQFDPNIDPNVERMANGSLLIKLVSKQYEGKYRCTPFNKHGSAGSSAAMEVRVEEAPQFELKPAEFYKATINGFVKIPCDAQGLPKPTISWRRVITNNSGSSRLAAAAAAAGKSNRMRRISGSGAGSKVVENIGHQTDEGEYQPAKLYHQTIKPARQLITSASQVHDNSSTTGSEPQEENALGSESDEVTMISVGGSGDNNNGAWEQQQTYRNQQQQEQHHHQQQQQPEQSVIISYAKLPSDRSEYKQSHLFLHGLRKEDHGKYECVVENEVATLIASTMLYIEETTPHSPSKLMAEPKAWSVHLSWTPGYDGGFEQSFFIWYRQVAEAEAEEAAQDGGPMTTSLQRQHELIDFNWKSVSVQPSDATSFTIQNLSQDTSYEMYVRARNIIGDGPGSPTILVKTKRALTGAITPLSGGPEMAVALATTSGPDSEHLATSFPIPVASMSSGEEEDSGGGYTLHPTVMGIIHLVDISSTSPPAYHDNSQTQSASSLNSSGQFEGSSSPSDDDNNNTTQHNQNKVIRIYFPSKQQQQQQQMAPNTVEDPSMNSRRSDSQKTNPNNTTNSTSDPPQSTSTQPSTTQEPVDRSTAPQNVSIMKVAQGWVIQWQPPQRLASGPSTLERLEQLAMVASRAGNGNSHLPALSQIQQEYPTPSSSSLLVNTASVNLGQKQLEQQQHQHQHQQQQQHQQQPAAYTVEFREKGSGWQTLATSREKSLLLKDLKPGSEYSFRVIAHSAAGYKGLPTPEFKYLIPDNRRKPGGTEAMSAGVVSGILFFIACIVIAVCAVNMCNKRRKKKAEKAAYVMMACPVLESHQDIAALNSNSLMRNSARSAAAKEGGIPGLDTLDSGTGVGGKAKVGFKAGSSLDRGRSWLNSIAGKLSQSTLRQQEKVEKRGVEAAVSSSSSPEQAIQNHIRYTSNSPMPIDVVQEDDRQIERAKEAAETLDDDYWIRTPSDRKWGTLTLAASKLAERRERERNRLLLNQDNIIENNQTLQQAQDDGWISARMISPEVDSLADELNHHRQVSLMSSKTLPRSIQMANPNAYSSRQRTLKSFQQPVPEASRSFCPVATGQFYPAPEQVIDTTVYKPQQQVPRVAPMAPTRRSPQKPPPPQTAKVHQHQHQRSVSQLDASQLSWALQLQMASMQLQQHFLSSQQHYLMMPEQNAASEQGYLSAFAADRKSFARSTLPLASGALFQIQHQPALYPAPPKFGQMDLSDMSAHNQLMGFVEAGGSTWNGRLANNYNSGQALHTQAAYEQQRAVNHQDDDPITENACLGSYKRKRRLPHIEAQFTITKPPDLPPKTHLNRNVTGSRTLAGAGATMQSSPRYSNRSLSEEEALEQGRLFVRQVEIAAPGTPPRAESPPRPAPRSRQSWRSSGNSTLRSLPQSGQRSEQRRLRQQQLPIQVDTIDASEKIETYFRHYGQDMSRGLVQDEEHVNRYNNLERNEDDDNDAHSQMVSLEEATELTFQPYHNLPSLKYTISLPLREASDGRLVFEETSHLRRSRRGNNPKLIIKRDSICSSGRCEPETTAFSDTGSCRRRRRKRSSSSSGGSLTALASRRHGSSSSCPPAPMQRTQYNGSIAMANQNSNRCSLESAMNRPTFGHPELMLNATIALDSLEASKTSVKLTSSVNSNCQTHQNFEQSPPPPPVPKHRLTPTKKVTPEPPKAPGRGGSREEVSRMDSLSSQRTTTSSSTDNSSTDIATASESQTDHFVDDHYEFDLISSCSSRRSRSRNIPEPEIRTVKERSTFYTDQCSKEQPLVEPSRMRRRQSIDNQADHHQTPTPTQNENSKSNSNIMLRNVDREKSTGEDCHYDTVCEVDETNH